MYEFVDAPNAYHLDREVMLGLHRTRFTGGVSDRGVSRILEGGGE